MRFGLRHFGRTPFSTLTMVVVLALGHWLQQRAVRAVTAFAERAAAAGHRRARNRWCASAASTGSRARARPSVASSRIRSIASTRRSRRSSARWPRGRRPTSCSTSARSGERPAQRRGDLRHAGLLPGAGRASDRGRRPAGGPPRRRPARRSWRVISHALWDRHFGRAPDVVGRTLKVNGVPVTIVGVAPRRFAGARTGGSQMRVWLPLNARRQVQRTSASDSDQLRLGDLRHRGAPALRDHVERDAAGRAGHRRARRAADHAPVGGRRLVHGRRPAARRQLLPAVGRNAGRRRPRRDPV